MIVLSNTAAQTIAAGQALVLNTTTFKSGGCSCCGGIRNRGTNLCKKGNYEITFHGNIAAGAAATEVQLSIEVGGVVLPETVMRATSVAAGDVNNVSGGTGVHNCCGCSTVRIVNTGTVAVTVGANPALIIKEV